jgi:signal transduction histidine kinase
MTNATSYPALEFLRRNNILLLIIIASTAAILAVGSYQYYQYSIDRITKIAKEDIQYNAQVQSHAISEIVGNELDNIEGNLKSLAASPVIQRNEFDWLTVVLGSRQDITKELTDFYLWADESGSLRWISTGKTNNNIDGGISTSSSSFNNSQISKAIGSSVSTEDWYIQAKNTQKPYQSAPIISPFDSVKRLYVSYPVYYGNHDGGVFHGVVAAGIPFDKLNDSLREDLFPKYQSRVAIIDRNGTVLSSEDAKRIGLSVFSDEYKSILTPILAPGELQSLNDFFKRSVNGEPASVELTFSGKKAIFVGYPVFTDSDHQHHFGTITVRTYYTLAQNVEQALEEQRNFSLIVPTIIGSVAAAIAILVLSWNKNLEKVVSAKTTELKTVNKALLAKAQELETANEQLKVNDKMQQEFINVAAHELRTPIQPIIGVADILESEFNGKERIEISKDELDMIIRNAHRLEHLSSDILEVSRIESQGLMLNKELVNLNVIAQQVINDCKSFIERDQQPHVKIILQARHNENNNHHHPPVLVEADKYRISQVISNLVRNAIKFTKEGEIFVVIEEKDGDAVVTVKDTGKGIDPEIMPKLFTKFATKSDQGTGLGLYISKSIVEAHGGKIWAENNNSDGSRNGATFAFSLPLVPGISKKESTVNV